MKVEEKENSQLKTLIVGILYIDITFITDYREPIILSSYRYPKSSRIHVGKHFFSYILCETMIVSKAEFSEFSESALHFIGIILEVPIN